MRVTVALIALNAAVFAAQGIFDGFTEAFALVPEAALSGAWWQFISYMFLHGGVMHITLNMFMLFLFGEVMEHALGKSRYIMLYVLSGLGSALIFLALTFIAEMPLLGTSMLGASGAVFGIMAGYGLMFPKDKIWVPYFIVPLPAFTVVILLAAAELVLGFLGLEPGIANFGHFGGIISGLALTYYWKKTVKPRTIDEKRNHEFYWE